MVQIIPLVYLLVLSIIIVIIGTATSVSAQLPNSRVSLQTGDGLFIGTREPIDRDRSRREFYSFTGIPCAKPPVGERRCKPAELLEVGTGSHHATTFGPQCPQYDAASERMVGSENCLFLNIFTPYVPRGVVPVGGGSFSRGGGSSGGVPPQSSRPLLPVIVYIHGGGLQSGGGDLVGPKRLMRNDVVLVTINYRLGALGYLSTGDGVIDGNLGAKDQIVALQWLQKYIRGFGGNPARVTIMGSSAGAASVHMLMLSPLALGLFHAAIIQSGSAFCDWAISENPREVAFQFGDHLDCSTSDSEELLNCLQEKPVEDLIQAQNKLKRIVFLPINFAPVVDSLWNEDPFLPDSPRTLMDSGAFAQVPVITGVVHDEGLSTYAQIHLELGAERFRDPDYFENILLPELLESIMDSREPLKVTVDAVKAQYFQEMDVANETKRVITELSQMIGDQAFYSCHLDMLERFAEVSKSPVYSYVFSHKTHSSPSVISTDMRKIRQMGIHHPLFTHGVTHGDELYYLFDPIKGSAERLGPEDERVSDLITSAGVSFATTGSPASGLQLIPNSVAWRPIKPGNINYYNITSLPSPMGEDFRKGEALFWLRTIPYIQQLGSTISDLEDYPTYFWVVFGIAMFLLVVTLILLCLLWKARTY